MGLNPFDVDWNELWKTPFLVYHKESGERPIVININIKNNKILMSDEFIKQITTAVKKQLGENRRIQINYNKNDDNIN